MNVIAVMKSSTGPREVCWAKDGDEVTAMLAVTQLLQHAKSDDPWAPKITSIRIDL